MFLYFVPTIMLGANMRYKTAEQQNMKETAVPGPTETLTLGLHTINNSKTIVHPHGTDHLKTRLPLGNDSPLEITNPQGPFNNQERDSKLGINTLETHSNEPRVAAMLQTGTEITEIDAQEQIQVTDPDKSISLKKRSINPATPRTANNGNRHQITVVPNRETDHSQAIKQLAWESSTTGGKCLSKPGSLNYTLQPIRNSSTGKSRHTSQRILHIERKYWHPCVTHSQSAVGHRRNAHNHL